MKLNLTPITRYHSLLLLLAGLLMAACSPAASPPANTVQPTLAATSTAAALAPAPTEAPAIKAATLPAAASPTAPTAYPEPQTGAPPEDAYPAPAMAEGLEGYPGVTVMEAPEGLDLDPATVGMALPLLSERLAAGETVSDLTTLADPLLTLIVADAARRTGVDAADLTAVAIQPVTWPATDLGCPDPELGYAQVQIEGYILTLTGGGEDYTYHTDGGLQVVLCLEGTPVAISPTPQQ